MTSEETPVDEALELINSGLGDSEVIKRLADKGYSPVDISEALNQAKIKKEISPEGLTPSILSHSEDSIPKPSVPKPMAVPPMQQMPAQKPSPKAEKQEEYQYQAYPNPYAYPTYQQQAQEPVPKLDTEAIEEIAEEIVNEKWLEIRGKISDVLEWKAYADKRILSVDERVKRIELSLDRLQAALLAKVQEYGRDVKDLGAEMHSLENAFGKILNPLIDNVKELSKITDEMKEKPARKKSE